MSKQKTFTQLHIYGSVLLWRVSLRSWCWCGTKTNSSRESCQQENASRDARSTRETHTCSGYTQLLVNWLWPATAGILNLTHTYSHYCTRTYHDTHARTVGDFAWPLPSPHQIPYFSIYFQVTSR